MKKLALTALFVPLLWIGCSNNGSNTTIIPASSDETGQQVGDAMASIDEAGGGTGSIALNNSIEKTFKRLSPKDIENHSWMDLIVQPAYAAHCFGPATFGGCSSNSIVRSFNGCTVGAATFQGNVTLLWDGTSTNCHLGAAGDSITRIPDFTVTGLRGATLTVSKTGVVGQNLAWVSGTTTSKVFSFTNDGINRKFTSGATTLFDFTTKTTSAITVTGTDRAHRVLSGGELQVTNNKTSTVCTYVPTAVTWDSTACNCPTSGTWDGTCTGGKTTKVEITGCGTANLTIGADTNEMIFDRCEHN